MDTASIKSLLAELASISDDASKLQDDGATEAIASSVADSYYDWYARALNVLPEDLKERFRDAFEGGTFTSKIQSFLAHPKALNAMYDPEKPENPLTAKRYQFEFQTNFQSHANAQRQILVEASHRTEVPRHRSGPGVEGDVFIVHGHAENHLHAVARLVERVSPNRAIVLREQPNGGRTIIEKFEAHAEQCAFAIVLLTADDHGGSTASNDDQPRARQNVVFEAGYFVGLLGRSNVVLMYEPGVELPSDLNGVLYIELANGWGTNVATEMRNAGLAVDLNQLRGET